MFHLPSHSSLVLCRAPPTNLSRCINVPCFAEVLLHEFVECPRSGESQ
jgi:hypothetical protein